MHTPGRYVSLLALPTLPMLAIDEGSKLTVLATEVAKVFPVVSLRKPAVAEGWAVGMQAHLAVAHPSSNHCQLGPLEEAARQYTAAALALTGWSGLQYVAYPPPSTPGMCSPTCCAKVTSTAGESRLAGGLLICEEDGRVVRATHFEAVGGSGVKVCGRPMDPVAEHRVWSPWLHVVSGDDAPAWVRHAALVLPLQGQTKAPLA